MRVNDWNTGKLTSYPPAPKEENVADSNIVILKVTDWNTGTQTDWQKMEAQK